MLRNGPWNYHNHIFQLIGEADAVKKKMAKSAAWMWDVIDLLRIITSRCLVMYGKSQHLKHNKSCEIKTIWEKKAVRSKEVFPKKNQEEENISSHFLTCRYYESSTCHDIYGEFLHQRLPQPTAVSIQCQALPILVTSDQKGRRIFGVIQRPQTEEYDHIRQSTSRSNLGHSRTLFHRVAAVWPLIKSEYEFNLPFPESPTSTWSPAPTTDVHWGSWCFFFQDAAPFALHPPGMTVRSEVRMAVWVVLSNQHVESGLRTRLRQRQIKGPVVAILHYAKKCLYNTSVERRDQNYRTSTRRYTSTHVGY